MMAEERERSEGGEGRWRAWSPRNVRARLRRRLVEDVRDVVMVKDLAGDRAVVKSAMRAVEGDRQAVRRFCLEHEETRRQWVKFESYLDNGYRVLLAEVEGRIVGHIWWHDRQVAPACVHPHLVRYHLRLEPGQVWGFDLYLLPQSRGGGASNDFFALFRRHLREAGYATVYGHVDAGNTAAVWLHKLQGYRPVKTVEGRLYCKVFLWSGGRLLVRNPPVGVKQKFDFHALW